jgi:hypothetical protein
LDTFVKTQLKFCHEFISKKKIAFNIQLFKFCGQNFGQLATSTNLPPGTFTGQLSSRKSGFGVFIDIRSREYQVQLG